MIGAGVSLEHASGEVRQEGFDVRKVLVQKIQQHEGEEHIKGSHKQGEVCTCPEVPSLRPTLCAEEDLPDELPALQSTPCESGACSGHGFPSGRSDSVSQYSVMGIMRRTLSGSGLWWLVWF